MTFKAWLLSGVLILCAQPALAQEAGMNLEQVYLTLHQAPELSNKETQTASFMASEFRAIGFDVTENVGGTGVVGVFENGAGPTVLLRADMDALPVVEQTGKPYASTVTTIDDNGAEVGVMHACGHDVHMTVLIGTARDLVARSGEWSGTLIVIAQPAEELGQGARAMLGDGLFERFPRPDYNLALHVNAAMPAGTVGYVSGYALANVDSVDITIHGEGGHGAYPHTTKDPVVLAAQIILGLQTIVSREISPTEPAVVTVGSIHGGTKHNIIGDEVKLQLTLRSYSPEVREQTIAAIRRMTAGYAAAAGLPEDKYPTVSVKDEFTPSTYNDPDLTASVVGSFRRAIGDENVIEVSPVMGGEDFGQYGRVEPKIPSQIYWLGAVEPATYAASEAGDVKLPSLHSPFFAPDYDLAIETGVATMTTAAIDLFNK